MKIGIELRQVTLGQSGGISQLLQNVLETLFALHPEQDYVFFSTIFNRGLLERLPERAEVATLPLDRYYEELARLAVEKRIDVLFRGYPVESELTFPASRKVFEIPDIQHEYYPQFFSAEVLQPPRRLYSSPRVGRRRGHPYRIHPPHPDRTALHPLRRYISDAPRLAAATRQRRRPHRRRAPRPRRRLLSLSRQPLAPQKPSPRPPSVRRRFGADRPADRVDPHRPSRGLGIARKGFPHYRYAISVLSGRPC